MAGGRSGCSEGKNLAAWEEKHKYLCEVHTLTCCLLPIYFPCELQCRSSQSVLSRSCNLLTVGQKWKIKSPQRHVGWNREWALCDWWQNSETRLPFISHPTQFIKGSLLEKRTGRMELHCVAHWLINLQPHKNPQN